MFIELLACMAYHVRAKLKISSGLKGGLNKVDSK